MEAGFSENTLDVFECSILNFSIMQDFAMGANLTYENRINSILEDEFFPDYLEVVNESSQHNVPPNSETHFKVTIVSSAFKDVRRVPRHQLVYKALAELLSGSVHALALHTYTSEEWIKRGNNVPSSPHCMGGGVQN